MSDITLVNVLHAGGQAVGYPGPITPLGCLYLTAKLQQCNYSVDFRDYQFCEVPSPQDPLSLADFMEDSADIIGVSCLADQLPLAVLAAEIIKWRHPEKTIILGGPGPSGVAQPLMATFPFIDIVAVGEGEETIVELLEALDGGMELHRVKSILYRDNGAVRSTGLRPRILDLDSLPFPQPRGVDISRYSEVNLISSRGCPYQCAFCDVSPLWGRRITYRSLDNVMSEMAGLAQLGIKRVSIQDDNFLVDKKRTAEFSRKLAQSKGLPKWACLGRVDLVDEPLLSVMREGGCTGMFFGVESGSDRVLKEVMKNTETVKAIHSVQMAMDYFGNVQAYFIWGFPTETLVDLAKTLLLLGYLGDCGARTNIALLCPFPNSTLYRQHRGNLVFRGAMPELRYLSLFPNYLPESRTVYELAKSHPEVFPSFYVYRTEAFEDKLRFMVRFRETHDLWKSVLRDVDRPSG